MSAFLTLLTVPPLLRLCVRKHDPVAPLSDQLREA